MTFTTDCIGGAGGAGWSQGIGEDLGDLAFIVAAWQLEQLDLEVGDKLVGLQTANALKKAYRERLAQLGDWMTRMKDDKLVVPEEEAARVDYAWSAADGEVSASDAGGSMAKESSVYRVVDADGKPVEDLRYVARREEDGTVVYERCDLRGRYAWMAIDKEQTLKRLQEEYPGCSLGVEVTRDQVSAEVARLQGKLDDLNADSELELLGINRLLARRNQALQLASNIMGSVHQSAMGIIANIK